MDFDALADFNAVARHGGFGAAGRATGQPKASLSRRVRALETALGVRLIERGGRALRLTEEGVALHGRTADLLAEIADIGEDLAAASDAPKGRLRVNVPTMAASESFGRTVAAFVAKYPAVTVEVIADDRFVDPVAEAFDVVLRANPAPDSRLVGQCVRTDTYVVAAHPSLSLPAPSTEPIPIKAVVLAGATTADLWHVDAPAGPMTLKPIPTLRLSSLTMVLGAALEGAGAGLFPSRLVADALESGRLVGWGAVPDRRVEVWALHPSRRLASAKVKLFLAAMHEAFGGNGSSGRSADH